MEDTIEFHGIGTSPGIAIGECYILDRSRVHISSRSISDEGIEAEKERFLGAVAKSREQLEHVRSQIKVSAHHEHALIIDTHIAILDDDLFRGATLKIIEEEKINAEFALRKVLDETGKIFNEINDNYLKERFTDVDFVGERTLRNLVGRSEQHVSDIDKPSVIVAHDLSPADTAQMNREKVLGFAISRGGPTSHTAIIARSLEIPAVVAVEKLFYSLRDGDKIIIDGTTGRVVIRPNAELTEFFENLLREYQEIDRELHADVHLPAVTLDGHRISVSANIEIIHELPLVEKHGADSIGLYRTEYLYLDRSDAPSEEEHYQNYARAVKAVKPGSVTIRTLDLGGDKFSHAFPVAPELNPAMGLRAIRFCLREVGIFRLQLRAILRASAHGKVRVMFPMISGVSEVREALRHLNEVKEELKREGLPFDEKIQVGCMIEIPSAAILAERLAEEVDFFSIGTNDLIQYTLAIDRINEHVSYLYEPLHPAVLSLIRGVARAARQAGKDVAMCGEMAGIPMYIPLLVGLGITTLSMPSQAIPRAKRIIRAIRLDETRKLAQDIFRFDTAAEINNFLREKIKEKWSEAYPQKFLQE